MQILSVDAQNPLKSNNMGLPQVNGLGTKLVIPVQNYFTPENTSTIKELNKGFLYIHCFLFNNDVNSLPWSSLMMYSAPVWQYTSLKWQRNHHPHHLLPSQYCHSRKYTLQQHSSEGLHATTCTAHLPKRDHTILSPIKGCHLLLEEL